MRRLWRVFALLLVLAPVAKAQQADGALEGRILDASGQPLADAGVTVSGPSLQGTRHVLTDRNGHFELPALPVGEYVVKVEHVAHQPMTIEHVAVGLGTTTSLGSIQLKTEVHEVSGVTVSRPKAIDRKTTTTGRTLAKSEIDARPSDRDFRSLALLSPEATVGYAGEEPNVSGSTGEGNYYFIDGSDATDPATGGTSTRLPYDFIQAVEVKTGGYQAEFGRALGGIVNVITPSGGDEVHGQVFGYFTGQSLAATSSNSLQYAGPSFSAYDIGVSASGPLIRDRLWWFAAYNPALDHRELNVPGIPTQETNSTSHRLAGKLTWQASERTNLKLTVVGDPTHADLFAVPFVPWPPPTQVLNADALLGDNLTGGINVSLQALQQLGPRSLLRVSVARVHNRSIQTPTTERGNNEPYFYDNETGTASGGYGIAIKDHSDRIAAGASLVTNTASHAFKVGLEYVDNWMTQDHEFGAGKAHEGFIERFNDSNYTSFTGFAVGTVHMHLPTVYAQDSYSASDRLVVNAGLRWDGDYIIDSQGQTAVSITDGFQPRLGLTYLLGRTQHHKVSASYGRFYEQIPAWSPGYYFFDSKQVTSNYHHDPRVDPSGGSSAVLLSSPPGTGDIKGQYFDEFTAGFESEPAEGLVLGLHGRFRKTGQVVEDALSPVESTFVLGNPGRGIMSYLPKAKQSYAAIALSASRTWKRADVFTSYVLSRNTGNYQGLSFGNAGPQFDSPDALRNTDGRLPNDRTHVFKLDGTYRPGHGLTAGASGVWESGIPLNELGRDLVVNYVPVFLQPRGSVGRSVSLWDLNLRFTYDGLKVSKSLRPKLVLDLFHVGNPRRPVQFDELHYTEVDSTTGAQKSPNPNYLKPTLYQPAFSARLGAVMSY